VHACVYVEYDDEIPSSDIQSEGEAVYYMRELA
jgi:hypothetical protein